MTPSTKVTSGSEGSPESERDFPAPPGLEVQAVSLAHALGIEKEETQAKWIRIDAFAWCFMLFPNSFQCFCHVPSFSSCFTSLGEARTSFSVKKEPQEKEEAFVFKLTLRVADDADLGLCFEKKGEVLEITDITSGAAESWNRQCFSSGSPERVLCKKDLVVAVNDQSELEQMLLEAKRKLVTLRVLRVAPREVVQYPLPFPTGLGYGSRRLRGVLDVYGERGPADWTFPWA